MEESKSILHELYVYSEWKPEPEYIQKPDGLLPENISALWRWIKFLGPKKSLIDSVTAHKEKQQKWHIAVGEEGKVIAVLTDNILEIRTKRSDYATIAARTTVSRDAYYQWRKLVWSPDCTFVVVAYGNGVVSFFDLTASNLFNIPIDCSRPGGLECTDNTHAVADIIFMPLRVKDTKWSWEVLIINYDGKIRGFLVSQMDGYSLHHTITFGGGIAAVVYCNLHSTLYVAGVPRGSGKDPNSAHNAGITAWRILNDEPHYKLSVVSDQLEGQVNDKFQFYIPFLSTKNLAFVVQMCLSPDGSKLVCIHCNGDVSIWRLPLLKLLHRFPLTQQPEYDVRNPLVEESPGKKDQGAFYPADVNWWSNEEVIVSRFSGSVSVCSTSSLRNVLARRVFLVGAPRVSEAWGGAALALECETSVLPQRTRTPDNNEVVKVEEEPEDSMLDLLKELVKYVVFCITDLETFQPRPRRVTCLAHVYRLLALKTTTPTELFSRKIEAGNYSEALKLAETFNLDSDLVYQQQWRKNPVSTDAIQKYLSKVSKKIWAVHQCVDRLPETLPAAKELLQFGLELTNDKILEEINKERSDDDKLEDPEDIKAEDLNAYTSELLRCRHVMLFYRGRLHLYEAILKHEKSTYAKDEYDRLRSNSVLRSSMEIAKEGRIEALTCLWPHIKTTTMKLAVLEKLPETINPMEYQHLLPTKMPMQWFETKSPIKVPPTQYEHDWCRKEIFRPIWSSNWSEETTPDTDIPCDVTDSTDISKWYEKRAREIEHRSGLVSHALTLTTLATIGGGVDDLDTIVFHLQTLDTLVYDRNVEEVTLEQLEKMSVLDTCALLMKTSTEATFVSDIKDYLVPFLMRYEKLTKQSGGCLSGLLDYLESISVEDLAPILLILKSQAEYKLDVRTQLELAERCLLAHTGTEQLDVACDILNTILRESDGSVPSAEMVGRVGALERLVAACTRVARRGVPAAPRTLRDTARHPHQARALLTRLARDLPLSSETKPTPADWEKLLKDILDLQSTLFDCVTKEQCYEIYASALLTSGEAASIRLSAGVLTCEATRARAHVLGYEASVALVLAAAREYFNSASALNDPALQLAKCCLTLIKDDNPKIQEELNLISALQILQSFNLTVIPVQVRLCENRLSLIEDCLKSEPNAFLASHKLLKLATLLGIEGDDEIARERSVLELVCARAISAGGGGGEVMVSAARRLAVLRHAPALLAAVARDRYAHADTHTRRQLLAAAVAATPSANIEDMLVARLNLELETLQQAGITVKEATMERCPSTDDEYADAITTPVIERRDLVAPQSDSKLPLFNYLLDTFQNTFSIGESKTATSEESTRSVHVQEFYQCLYSEHEVCLQCYRYDKFSMPDVMSHSPSPHDMLKWYYIQNCVDEDGFNPEIEDEVVTKCGSELVYSDTGLSTACLTRGARGSRSGVQAAERYVTSHHSDAALATMLYATAIHCNANKLRDNVYLARPVDLAEMTVNEPVKPRDEQLSLIRQCIDRLSGMAEVESLRAIGLNVNGLLFNADPDYRKEVIYRVASEAGAGCAQLELAWSLCDKYGVSRLDAWLRHAASPAPRPRLAHLPPPHTPDTHTRILEDLYPNIPGNDYSMLIQLFTILKNLDEKAVISGLTAAEHIKLMKKAKAASPELDYKLVISSPSPEHLTSHLLEIMKPESVGMIAKFLRTLPAQIKLPFSINQHYTKWLTKYFFSVPPASASSKKWMQQYRQCASYFNKLTKEELMNFVNETCFSDDAIERVPAGTRNLMIMQAVDYCQQEQENDLKLNKNEQTWAQVGQELTRWARFLENFHSTAVQNIIENSRIPKDEVWPEIEKSHGDLTVMTSCAGELILHHNISPAAMTSLLQCLHVDLSIADIFTYLHEHCVNTVYESQRLVRAAAVFGAARVTLASPPSTLHMLREHWPEQTEHITEEQLQTECGQREVFHSLMNAADTLQQKKALVDVLACWMPARDIASTSLHCEFLKTLLSDEADPHESLMYISLLMRHPLLNDEEIQLLTENVKGKSVPNMIWIILLNKCPKAKDLIIKLVQDHKEEMQEMEIDDLLIKELLDHHMLIPLIPTVLYSCVVGYLVGQSAIDDKSSELYNVRWAANEMMECNYLAEAGHLFLMATGVPASLKGYSQAIRFCKDRFMFKP